MYAFEFVKPSTVEEAVRALAGGEAQALGGGQTLIPTMKQRLANPGTLVSLTGIASIKGVSMRGGELCVGGGTTHAEVASDAKLKAVCPALSFLASHIGDPHVRHKGTIGGSIANNDPAADYPAAMLALGATIVTNKREIAADKFFTGLFETALKDGEIVTGVSFTAPDEIGPHGPDHRAKRPDPRPFAHRIGNGRPFGHQPGHKDVVQIAPVVHHEDHRRPGVQMPQLLVDLADTDAEQIAAQPLCCPCGIAKVERGREAGHDFTRIAAGFLKGFQRAALHGDGIQLFHGCDGVTLVQVDSLSLQPLKGLP